jgi:hypothetical protein
MESDKEKLKRWEKESSQMFAGWVIAAWLGGKEYLIDSSHKDEVEKMEGAEIRPIRFYL